MTTLKTIKSHLYMRKNNVAIHIKNKGVEEHWYAFNKLLKNIDPQSIKLNDLIDYSKYVDPVSDQWLTCAPQCDRNFLICVYKDEKNIIFEKWSTDYLTGLYNRYSLLQSMDYDLSHDPQYYANIYDEAQKAYHKKYRKMKSLRAG